MRLGDTHMKIGIACVYFYGEDAEWIMELQLRYIASMMGGHEYRVFAGANRLSFALRNRLAATANLEIVSLPWFDGEGSEEHAFYLDKLLDRAAADGCTHLATVDADSFPVLADWPDALIQRMGKDVRLAAVLRAENLDTHLPHPCGLFMERSFFLQYKPSMLPSKSEISSPSFQEFIRQTGQRIDTGIGYGYVLWKHKEPWLPLMRSNKWNPHFIMAGIYGDVFFHLGATSRRQFFYVEFARNPLLHLMDILNKYPVIWRVSAWISPWLREKRAPSNARVFRSVSSALRTNPERFIEKLRSPLQL